MKVGQLVHIKTRRTFRIAIVLRVVAPRIAIWSNNGRGCWVVPKQQNYDIADLEPLSLATITAAQRRSATRALVSVNTRNGFVHHRDGGVFVGEAVAL